MSSERASARAEIPALLIAFALAPLASLATWTVGWGLFTAIVHGAGLQPEAYDPNDSGHFLGAFIFVACAGYWCLTFPIAILLRARGKLSFWSTLLPAAALPTATTASLATLSWQTTGQMPLAWFLLATTFFVSGTVPTALAFWGLYCFFTGHHFFASDPDQAALTDPDRA